MRKMYKVLLSGAQLKMGGRHSSVSVCPPRLTVQAPTGGADSSRHDNSVSVRENGGAADSNKREDEPLRKLRPT